MIARWNPMSRTGASYGTVTIARADGPNYTHYAEMTPLEIILSWALLVALSALWWTYRFLRIHQEDAAFYKEAWREECEIRDELIQLLEDDMRHNARSDSR